MSNPSAFTSGAVQVRAIDQQDEPGSRAACRQSSWLSFSKSRTGWRSPVVQSLPSRPTSEVSVQPSMGSKPRAIARKVPVSHVPRHRVECSLDRPSSCRSAEMPGRKPRQRAPSSREVVAGLRRGIRDRDAERHCFSGRFALTGTVFRNREDIAAVHETVSANRQAVRATCRCTALRANSKPHSGSSSAGISG